MTIGRDLPRSRAWIRKRPSLQILAVTFVLGLQFAGSSFAKPFSFSDIPSKHLTAIEQSYGLGAGFRMIYQQIESAQKPADEAVEHYTFIYFRNKLICRGDRSGFFLSPHKRFAIIRNDDSGGLLLVNIRTQKVTTIAENIVGYPETVSWNEKRNVAYVHFLALGLSKLYQPTLKVRLR